MRKNLIYLLLPFLALVIASCSNDLDPLEAGNHRSLKKKTTSKKYTMKLSLGGDFITESEEPLFRADETGDTYVGINVWSSKILQSGALEDKKRYAYCVYKYENADYDNDISIDIFSGYKYTFEATILKEGIDKMSVTKGGSFSEPFKVKDTETFVSVPFKKEDLNKIIETKDITDENKKPYLTQLSSGATYIAVGKADGVNADWNQETGVFHYPRVKRFYGKKDFVLEISSDDSDISTRSDDSNIENSEDNENADPNVKNIEIPMAYKCFGLQINIVNLPDETTLTVYDTHNPTTGNEQNYVLFPKNLVFSKDEGGITTWEGLYSMHNLKEETENISLKFIWHKADGTNQSFPATFTVKQKTRKIINVDLTGSAYTKGEGNIVFTDMDEDLTDDNEKVDIKDH